MGEADGDFRVLALREWGLEGQGYPCVSCGTVGSHVLHHHEYLSRGGPRTDPSNLLPLCHWDHEQVHLEKLTLVWIDGVVVTRDNIKEEIVSRTPWPPNQGLVLEYGKAIQQARDSLVFVQGSSHGLIATEIPGIIQSVDEIGQLSQSTLLRLAHEALERAPKRARTKAAKALAESLNANGYETSATTVRNLADQYEVAQLVGIERFEEVPAMVRKLAADAGTPESGLQVIESYFERPIVPDGKGGEKQQGARAFVAAHYEQARAEPENTLIDLCQVCGGATVVRCDNCEGTGRVKE